MFRPAFGCAQHPKAGRNTQQPWAKLHSWQQTNMSRSCNLVSCIKKLYSRNMLNCAKTSKKNFRHYSRDYFLFRVYLFLVHKLNFQIISNSKNGNIYLQFSRQLTCLVINLVNLKTSLPCKNEK